MVSYYTVVYTLPWHMNCIGLGKLFYNIHRYYTSLNVCEVHWDMCRYYYNLMWDNVNTQCDVVSVLYT